MEYTIVLACPSCSTIITTGFEMAMSTWPKEITPAVHYSESRSIEKEDPKIKPQAHSDYVLDFIDTYGNDVDIMIEAKKKELAVEKYLKLYGVLHFG